METHQTLASSGRTPALVVAAISTIVEIGFAQADDALTIRVETNEVVVPVYVVQKRESAPKLSQMEGLKRGSGIILINGLSASNFRISEDGKEQEIKSVTVQDIPFAGIEDRHFRHLESCCALRGRWASGDETPDLVSALWNTDPGVHVNQVQASDSAGQIRGGAGLTSA